MCEKLVLLVEISPKYNDCTLQKNVWFGWIKTVSLQARRFFKRKDKYFNFQSSSNFLNYIYLEITKHIFLS